MLAQVDSINKLGPLQDQITAPNNGPEVVLDNLGKHAVWGRWGTDPDGGGELLPLGNIIEKFFEIIQRRRYYHLIVRAARDLENKHSYELTNDLGINSDSKPIHSGQSIAPRSSS
jgi:hypothetical protein